MGGLAKCIKHQNETETQQAGRTDNERERGKYESAANAKLHDRVCDCEKYIGSSREGELENVRKGELRIVI